MDACAQLLYRRFTVPHVPEFAINFARVAGMQQSERRRGKFAAKLYLQIRKCVRASTPALHIIKLRPAMHSDDAQILDGSSVMRMESATSVLTAAI